MFLNLKHLNYDIISNECANQLNQKYKLMKRGQEIYLYFNKVNIY